VVATFRDKKGKAKKSYKADFREERRHMGTVVKNSENRWKTFRVNLGSF